MNYIKFYYSAAVGNAVCINQNNHVKQTIFLFFSLVGNITHDITLQTTQNCKTFSLKQPVNTFFIQNLNDANVSCCAHLNVLISIFYYIFTIGQSVLYSMAIYLFFYVWNLMQVMYSLWKKGTPFIQLFQH